ncbi:MAG: RluA family pseudouridine synthase [Bacteroidales bacterium]|nr:RluA family pseudouridine synthase [Bacteroidales bacterium]
MNKKKQDFIEESEEKELYEHYRFVVDKGQGLLRIDKYLMDRIENASRNKIQGAAAHGNILVNGVSVKPSYKVKPDDLITIMMEDPVREIKLFPQDIPLDVVYEDDDLIVVNKPTGMVVHPAYGNYSGTLVNALLFHFEKNAGKNPGKLASGPFLVHRIDKDTSGLMMVAKNEIAQVRLQSQFYHHTIDRKYVAMVWGDLKAESGTIEGHVGRHKTMRKLFTVYEDGSKGKHAVTHYKVIERFGYVSLVECELETGRTHQIRVHLKHLGHPLFNDETYGGSHILRGTTFSRYQQFVNNCFKICSRQALHAKSLGFDHPTTGEHLFFESDLAADMQELIEKWRNYAVHKLLDP